MLRIRILATSASVLAFLAVILGSAAAQTATTGAPLPLLQFLQQKSKAKPKPAPRPAAKLATRTTAKRWTARRTIAKTHKAVAQGARTRAATATASLPNNTWPGADTAAPGNAALANVAPANSVPANAAPDGGMQTTAPQSSSPSVTTEKVVETNPNEVMANGAGVQLTSPEELNPVELAAQDGDGPAKTATTAPASDPVVPEPVVHAMLANTVPDPTSPVGSASWIAHVLAALCGAITAGVVAWFLIGPMPRRNYG